MNMNFFKNSVVFTPSKALTEEQEMTLNKLEKFLSLLACKDINTFE
jgi:hypothetical protein